MPMWNGPIECRLFRFDMPGFDPRALADQLDLQIQRLREEREDIENKYVKELEERRRCEEIVFHVAHTAPEAEQLRLASAGAVNHGVDVAAELGVDLPQHRRIGPRRR